MQKLFLSADALLKDAYELASLVHRSDWQPTWLVGVWRGGTPVAIAMHEWLSWKGLSLRHCPIVTQSYTGIAERQAVQVIGTELLREKLDAQQRVLIVDDVFDTGISSQAVIQQLQQQGALCEFRIACPWFKPSNNLTQNIPDYYLRETDQWLVFPHELVGLSPEDVARKPVMPE